MTTVSQTAQHFPWKITVDFYLSSCSCFASTPSISHIAKRSFCLHSFETFITSCHSSASPPEDSHFTESKSQSYNGLPCSLLSPSSLSPSASLLLPNSSLSPDVAVFLFFTLYIHLFVLCCFHYRIPHVQWTLEHSKQHEFQC